MQKYYPSGHIFLIHFPDGTGTVLYPFCGMRGGCVVSYAVYLFQSRLEHMVDAMGLLIVN